MCGQEPLRRLADPAHAVEGSLAEELRGATQGAVHYRRVQLNFDAETLPLAVLTSLVAGWRNGQWRHADGTPLGLITQHNAANARVHELFLDPLARGRDHLPFYSVLFDESGGTGQRPRAWPRPFAGLRCGYAGGITPDNLVEVASAVLALQPAAQPPLWLDVESGLRTADRFDLGKAAGLIDAWRRLTPAQAAADRHAGGHEASAP